MSKEKDLKGILRRERRHFRKYINGRIVYQDVPFGNQTKLTKSSGLAHDEDLKENDISLLLYDEKNLVKDRDEKIKVVLKKIKEIVSPNLDSIVDAIYVQIKKDNDFNDFKKEKIQETVKNSRHYRASRIDKEKKVSPEIVETQDFIALIEDVFVQLEKEKIRNKTEKIKNEKQVEEKEKQSEIKNEKKQSKKKKIEKKSKKETKGSKKQDTKTSNIHNLLDDDFESDLDLSDDDDGDELGLKF